MVMKMRINKEYLLRIIKIIEKGYKRSKHYYKKKDEYIIKILDNKWLDKKEIKKLKEILEKEIIFYNNANHFIINLKEKLNSLKRKSHTITNFLEILNILLPIIDKHQELIKEQHEYVEKDSDKLREYVKLEENLKISLDYKLKDIIHKLDKKNRSIIKKAIHFLAKRKKGFIAAIIFIIISCGTLSAGEVSKGLILPMFTNIEQVIQNIHTNVDIVWHANVESKDYTKEAIEEFITESVRLAIKINATGRDISVPRTIRVEIETKTKEGVLGHYDSVEDKIYLNKHFVHKIDKSNKYAMIIISNIIHEMTHLIDYYNTKGSFEAKETFYKWLYNYSQPKSEKEMNDVFNFYIKFLEYTETNAMMNEIDLYNYISKSSSSKDLNDEEKTILHKMKILKEETEKDLKKVKKGTYSPINKKIEEMRENFQKKLFNK